MKRHGRIALLAVLLGIAVAAYAPAHAQPARGEPYKIGVTHPLTGPLGAWGQILVPAIEIGVQHVNEAGGVNGRPLQLVIEDTKSTPDGGVVAMRKVVQVDRVPVVITIFTNVVTAQIPLADQLKVPIISTVEAPGLVAKSEWAFAHSTLLSRSLPLIAEWWKKEKVKRVFAFLPNTALAPFGATLLKAEAEKLGAAYEEVRFKLGEPDHRGLVARAKAFNPDAIMVWGHGTPDEGAIMKQVRELGITTQMYNGCACVTAKSYRAAAGQAGDGVIYAGFKYDRETAKKFIAPYRARLGFDPDYAGLEHYDIVFMIAEAIMKHGYTGDGVRRGLAEIKDFRSVGGGLVSMDPTGQSVVPVGLYRVKSIEKAEFEEIKP